MRKLVSSFIDNSFLVNLISVFMVIVGLTSLMTMKRDLIPQWKISEITIDISLNGASPEQVEKFITSPVEDSIQSFAGIAEVNSSSYQGHSSIRVKVKDTLDEKEVNDLYQKIESKVNGLRSSFPKEADYFHVENKKVNTFWFTSLSALNYDFYNPKHRRWLITTKEKLRKLPGIVEVRDQASWPSLMIKFKPEKLSRYRLKPDAIAKTVREYFELIPMGGLKQDGQTIRLQMEGGVSSPEDLNNIIVQSNASGSVVYLKDVANVFFGFDKIKFKSKTNGQNAVDLYLFKDLDTDTINLKGKLEKRLSEINAKAPKDLKVIITGDGPAYVERQLNVLKNNGIMGLVLVIFSLFIFLGGRSAIITCLGVPLAYFATFTVLSSMGISIDIISVVGMILILGILVDDAIIVSEQYSQFLEQGHKPRAAALMTVEKTMIPITGTVITTIVAFVPILLAKGGLSDFLYAIPWVVIAALVMSWLESFFILPNHLAHFVKKPRSSKEGAFFQKVKSVYKKTLAFSLKWRYLVFIFTIGFMVFTLIFAQKKVPMNFNLNIGSEKIRLISVLKKSSSIEETEKRMEPIWKLLKNIDKSKYSYISGNLGRAYYNHEMHEDIRFAQIDIRFNQTHPDIEGSKKFIMSFLEKELEKIKTNEFELLKVDKRVEGNEDVKEHAVSVYVTGREGMQPEVIIGKLSEVAKKIKETKTVDIDPKLFVETWVFQVDQNALKQHNISSHDVGLQIKNYIQKQEVKEFRFEGQNVKVFSQLEFKDNVNEEVLNNLKILGHYGTQIETKKLGKWIKKRTLRTIKRRNQEKTLKIDITFNEEKIKMEQYSQKLEKSLDQLQIKYPHLLFSIENANQRAEENKSSIVKMLVYCITMILFVLAVVLRSLSQPLLIASAIPFGIVGVIWAFYFHGQALEIMAMVGIIGMAGVVVNDSLIMVDTINKLYRKGENIKRELIIQGASSRLRAIILTSVTTLGGVFPMAYGLGGDAGFTKPLALSMGWGLLFATSITLVVIPCFLEIQNDFISLFNKVFRRKILRDSIPVTVNPELEIDYIAEAGTVGQKVESDERPTIQ